MQLTTQQYIEIMAKGIKCYVSWQMDNKGILHLDENSPFQLALIQANEYADRMVEEVVAK